MLEKQLHIPLEAILDYRKKLLGGKMASKKEREDYNEVTGIAVNNDQTQEERIDKLLEIVSDMKQTLKGKTGHKVEVVTEKDIDEAPVDTLDFLHELKARVEKCQKTLRGEY